MTSADDTIHTLTELRAEFRRLNREGVAALQKQDLGRFGRVIAEERELFDRQAHLMQEHLAATRKKR